MKKTGLRILTLALLLVAATCIAAFAEKKGGFNVQFQNLSMKEFVMFVAEFTGKNFVYDEQDLKGQVTVNSRSQMTSEDVMRVFNETLRLNGLAQVEGESFIQIVKKSDIKDYEDLLTSKIVKESGGVVTTIISLKSLNSATLVGVLAKVKSEVGYIDAVKGMNVIMIRDIQSRIDKMLAIIERLETEAGAYKLTVIPVRNSGAEKVARQLDKIFSELGKSGIYGEKPLFVADDASNMIVVAGTPSDIAQTNYLLSQLDTATSTDISAPKVIYLNNANAEDVEKVLNKLLSSLAVSSGAEDSSPAGAGDAKKPVSAAAAAQQQKDTKVSSDKATNSIIAMGSQEFYTRVEKLIEKLDVPRKQVYVEALILETTLEKGAEFGVEWLSGGKDGKVSGTVGFIKKDSNLVNFQSPVLDSKSPNFAALPGGFTLGVIGETINFNGAKIPSLGALVTAVRTDSGINILSNPQILTLDNEEAEVFVGENRPFLTSVKYDSNDNPIRSYDYRNVGVKLKVTPHVSGDDLINLKIEQEVNKVMSGTEEAPVTLTRQTKTRVQLSDGNIMVISGLIKDDSELNKSRVPGLGDIPLLGWLFKAESGSAEKTTMMVFLTTKIIRGKEDAIRLTQQKQVQAEGMKDRIAEELSGKKAEKKTDKKDDKKSEKAAADAEAELHTETAPSQAEAGK